MAETHVEANGAGAAALLAAGIGCFAMGAMAVAGDGSKALAKLLTFYVPTGPLSGVTTVAILVWVAAWVGLHLRWTGKNVAVSRVFRVALGLLVVGVLLTFPPIGDLLIGK